jgi:murein DD-endopeptidase MepM/ murein hydrolase activator NlpD
VKIKYGVLLFLFMVTIAANAQIRYAVIPENPRPGEPVTIGLAADSGEGGPLRAALVSGGQRLAKAAFFSLPGEDGQPPVFAAVLAVPSTAAPGRAVINVESAGGIIGQIDLDIAGREFIFEEIELNPSLTGIRTAPDPQKTAEAEQLWAILNRTGNEIFCFDTFCFPVASQRRTSFFGDRRVFKYSNGGSDTSVHAGVDYGVPKGTPVSACGPGRVVLARFRIVTGNSVIIEHLPGVYSLYYHLDHIDTAEGAVVSAGTRLGLSGATGLATGPHLHWEIRVSGENTDPDAFVGRPVLDKAAILDRINKEQGNAD